MKVTNAKITIQIKRIGDTVCYEVRQKPYKRTLGESEDRGNLDGVCAKHKLHENFGKMMLLWWVNCNLKMDTDGGMLMEASKVFQYFFHNIHLNRATSSSKTARSLQYP